MLVLGLVGVVGVMIAFIAALGGAVVARHRAESAADLAALAAAGCGCNRAAAVAGVNGGVLTACHRSGDGSYTVQVAVSLALPARLLHGYGSGAFLSRASARAVVLAGEAGS